MAEKINTYGNIPKEKFAFAHSGEKLTDRKFDDKPIGYFKDAWIRFRKNRASVIAAVIIMLVILYAFLAPLLLSHESSFMVAFYAKSLPAMYSFVNWESAMAAWTGILRRRV